MASNGEIPVTTIEEGELEVLIRVGEQNIKQLFLAKLSHTYMTRLPHQPGLLGFVQQ